MPMANNETAISDRLCRCTATACHTIQCFSMSCTAHLNCESASLSYCTDDENADAAAYDEEAAAPYGDDDEEGEGEEVQEDEDDEE